MANVITGNPWYLDTAGFAYTAGVYIKNIVWNNGTEGDSLLIQDNAGRDIINATYRAEGNNDFGEFKWVQGFHLVTLTTGGNLSVVIHGK